MMKWLKKIRGSVVIEAALTIPVVFYVIFFTIELIRINQIQIKLNAIAEECTMDYIVNKYSSNFADIVAKHGMQSEFANGTLAYEMIVYDYALGAIMESGEYSFSNNKYGASDVFIYPAVNTVDFLVTTDSEDGISTGGFLVYFFEYPNMISPRSGRGRPFMLTWTYKHEFSSSFVAMLFNGGTNSAEKTGYYLWARGVGICNL